MDFGLSDEEKMILQTVREFTDKEVRPLLPEVQKAEIRGERFPDRATVKSLQQKARTAGLWGLP
jgi:acyl-CoA dehydrogenase